MLVTLKEDNSLAGHRLIEVMFGEPLSRLPTLQALVDIGIMKSVVQVQLNRQEDTSLHGLW